jgi:hypothetical protein
MIDDDDDLPRGNLIDRIHDAKVHEQIRKADVVRGIHPDTGEQVGLFYGVAELNKIVRKGTQKTLVVCNVPVDPDTDDIETLCAMVQTIKGACCYKGRGED